MKLLTGSLALVALTLPTLGQINKPPASPRARLRQQVGLANVELDYGRPGGKGREIFGSLEPYGRVWRTGANASTKITFDRTVQFAGESVPPGTYALYTIPDEQRWTVILSKNTQLWGAGGYDPAQDLLRINVPVLLFTEQQETLCIDFERFHANGADLYIRWADVKIRVPVFVDTDEEILKEIDEKLLGDASDISAQTYFDAAMFFYEKQLDLAQASEWMDAAIELSPTSFWVIYFRAELALSVGDTELAAQRANQALKLATESKAGDFGYIAKSRLLLARLDE